MSIYVCRYLRLHVVDTFYKIKTSIVFSATVFLLWSDNEH